MPRPLLLLYIALLLSTSSYNSRCWRELRVRRVTMTNCWRGRSDSASLCRYSTSETTANTSRTRSGLTRPAPATRNHRRRWTSPAAVRCSRLTRRWRTRKVRILLTTWYTSESLSTLLICWTRNWFSQFLSSPHWTAERTKQDRQQLTWCWWQWAWNFYQADCLKLKV